MKTHDQQLSVARELLKQRRTIQKGRTGIENKMAAIKQGRDIAPPSTPGVSALQSLLSDYRGYENDLKTEVITLVQDIPLIQVMIEVPGVSWLTAARVAVYIPHPEERETVSKLWRYCGMSVQNGRAEHAKRFRRRPFCVPLKTALRVLTKTMLDLGSPYKTVYNSALNKYLARPNLHYCRRCRSRGDLCHNPQSHRLRWDSRHAENASIRYTAKVYLTHLWEASRILNALPTRATYVTEVLGHTIRYHRTDFGWPSDEQLQNWRTNE